MSETTRDALLTFKAEDYRRIARDCDCEGAMFIVMAHDYGRTTIQPETPSRSATMTDN